MEIQPDEHDADIWIQRFARRHVLVILRRYIRPQSRIRAPAERDPRGRQLRLDARLAEDEDFVLRRRGLQNEGDVDGAAVGGGKHFLEGGGDAHARELGAVVGAGFGGVIGHEDDLLALRAQEVEGGDGIGEEVVAGPEDAWTSRGFSNGYTDRLQV